MNTYNFSTDIDLDGFENKHGITKVNVAKTLDALICKLHPVANSAIENDYADDPEKKSLLLDAIDLVKYINQTDQVLHSISELDKLQQIARSVGFQTDNENMINIVDAVANVTIPTDSIKKVGRKVAGRCKNLLKEKSTFVVHTDMQSMGEMNCQIGRVMGGTSILGHYDLHVGGKRKVVDPGRTVSILKIQLHHDQKRDDWHGRNNRPQGINKADKARIGTILTKSRTISTECGPNEAVVEIWSIGEGIPTEQEINTALSEDVFGSGKLYGGSGFTKG